MAKNKSPEELEPVWDDQTQEAWNSLNPKQQDFFIRWLNNGYNATQAYWDTYDSVEKEKTAGAAGSRMLGNVNIQLICSKLNSNNASELSMIKKVYQDAMKADTPIFADGDKVMDIEDHKTRISAAEKLAKLNGELVDKAQLSGTDGAPLINVIERVIIKSEKS